METELASQWRPEQICEVLGIGISTYYNRLKYLEIEPSRDDEGPYLTQEQMKEMEDLNEHIKKTGKTRGFRGGGELAIPENSDLASALEIPEVEAENFDQMDDEMLSRLIGEAGELKVRQVAMPDLVRLHLANSMTEEDLSDVQREKIKAIRNAANPKPNAAAAIAQQLLQRHRQKQQKNQEPQ
jgi:ribosomal protein S10